jgi:large subunit ribosomal protein L27
MAHKKAGGSTQLGRDSESKRLGVKIYGGQRAKAGQVIVRQRGTRYHAGEGVRKGGDDTLFAAIDGTVRFSQRKKQRFTGTLKKITEVRIEA